MRLEVRSMRVIEQEQGHYEVREGLYGKTYSWHPGRVRVECDCRMVLDWEGPDTACRCGAKPGEDLSLGNLEGFDPQRENVDRPWLEDYEGWRDKKEANGLKCEYYAFVGVNDGA